MSTSASAAGAFITAGSTGWAIEMTDLASGRSPAGGGRAAPCRRTAASGRTGRSRPRRPARRPTLGQRLDLLGQLLGVRSGQMLSFRACPLLSAPVPPARCSRAARPVGRDGRRKSGRPPPRRSCRSRPAPPRQLPVDRRDVLGQLGGLADPDERDRDRRVADRPGDGELRHRLAVARGERLQPLDDLQLLEEGLSSKIGRPKALPFERQSHSTNLVAGVKAPVHRPNPSEP